MRKLLIAVSTLLIGSALVMEDAEARRLGGARSSGVQRSVTNTPPASTPAKPAQQQPAAGQQQAAPAAGTPAPAPSGLAKWAPMLGGLAIGGLLGALFAGNGLGGLLLVALLAVAAVVAFRLFARRQSPASQSMQYAGLNERISVPQPPAPGAAAAAPAVAGLSVPAGFDAAAFLRGAKLNFVKLQVANDAGNLQDIRELTTPEMCEALSKDVAERSGTQQTDVTSLDAELLEVTTEGDRHWASVRFSGLVRETPGTEPVEFQEVWNLAKPVDGSTGWLLAGIQQLQ